MRQMSVSLRQPVASRYSSLRQPVASSHRCSAYRQRSGRLEKKTEHAMDIGKYIRQYVRELKPCIALCVLRRVEVLHLEWILGGACVDLGGAQDPPKIHPRST